LNLFNYSFKLVIYYHFRTNNTGYSVSTTSRKSNTSFTNKILLAIVAVREDTSRSSSISLAFARYLPASVSDSFSILMNDLASF
jgi:hypothetical protein